MNEYSPQPSSTTEIQHQPDTREQTPEAIKNPRIQRLIQVRDDATRQLQEAIIDLKTRESDPAFQEAKILLGEGWEIGIVKYDSSNIGVLFGKKGENSKECIFYGIDMNLSIIENEDEVYISDEDSSDPDFEAANVFEVLGINGTLQNKLKILKYMEDIQNEK
jgi:hypothetical protein